MPVTAVSTQVPQGVVEAANARLRGTHYYSLKQINCQFDDGSLILRGRLGTFFEKQLAQEAVAGLRGVAQIVNCIEVQATVAA